MTDTMSPAEYHYVDVIDGRDDTANRIVADLTARGWAVDPKRRNLVRKFYGAHQAAVSVVPGRAGHRYWLEGEYHCDGRNRLERCCAFIDAPCDADELAAVVARFVAQAESAIGVEHTA